MRRLDNQRAAVVRALAQLLLERDLAEQWDIQLVGKSLTAALAEDRDALAVWPVEARHVLDHADEAQVDLASHLGGTPGNALRGRLRGRDHQDLRLRQELGQGHGDVAGPGRQVKQEVVELAPLDVLEKLLNRLMKHRPAPDYGGVLLDEETDRDHLDAACRVQRQDLAFR